MDRLMLERLTRMQTKTREMRSEMKMTTNNFSKLEEKLEDIKQERMDQGREFEKRLRRLSSDQNISSAEEERIAEEQRQEMKQEMKIIKMTEDRLLEMQNRVEKHTDRKLIEHSDDMYTTKMPLDNVLHLDTVKTTGDTVLPMETTVNTTQLLKIKDAMSEQLLSTQMKYNELKTNALKSGYV